MARALMFFVQRPSDDFVHGSGPSVIWDVLFAIALGIRAVASKPLDLPLMLGAEVKAVGAQWHV